MADLKARVQEFSAKAEDIVDRFGQPLKPYIPVIGRFLIVATFLEDALRITIQWDDQVSYMERARHFPSGLSHLFLGLNVIVRIETCIVAYNFFNGNVIGHARWLRDGYC